MREKLIAYIDGLFRGTVETQAAKDFRDELLQNTLDRFDEEIFGGKTEEEAYRIAVLSIGNTDELLKPFYPKRENTRTLRTVGLVLYCTSFVPIILLGSISGTMAVVGVAMMFAMIAAATVLMILGGRAKPTKEAENARLLRALGVGVIIASLSVLMLGIAYEDLRVFNLLPVNGAVLGVCGMFCTIAAGIALLVTAGQKDHTRTVPHVPAARDVEAPESAEPVMRPAIPKWVRVTGGIFTAVFWVLTVAVYLRVSFATGAWYYTWVIFVVASSLYEIARSIVRLCCGLDWLGGLIGAFLDLAAVGLFVFLTRQTGLWYATWLVFPIAGCLGGVAKGIIQLVKTTVKEEA